MTAAPAGLILAAGRGVRLKPLTDTRPKPMLPVAGKPILQYNIERLVAAGVREIAIVVPPDSDEIARAFGTGKQLGACLAYIIQSEPLGTGHAVALGRAAIGERRFYLTFGDNLTPWDIGRLAEPHERSGAAATLAVFRAADPRKHGVAELDGDRIARIVEKPEQPRSPWASAGMYLLEPVIFDAVARLRMSPSGEFHLPEAVENLIEQGETVAAARLDTWRSNVNTREEYLEANRLLLADQAQAVHAVACTITAPVGLGAEAHVHESAHLGPAVFCGSGSRIGEGARVENSVLLDSVTVQAGAAVRDCLIGEGALVQSGAVLERRVVGDGEQV